MVVVEIGTQLALEVRSVAHDHVIEQVSTNGSDEALHLRILPRRPGRRRVIVDAHSTHSGLKRGGVDRIWVADQEARDCVPRERSRRRSMRIWKARAIHRMMLEENAAVVVVLRPGSQ